MALVMPNDEKASAKAISMDMKRDMLTAEPLGLSSARSNRAFGNCLKAAPAPAAARNPSPASSSQCCTKTRLLPSVWKSMVANASLIPPCSIPGDPIGIPGTAIPAAFGRS